MQDPLFKNYLNFKIETEEHSITCVVLLSLGSMKPFPL